MKHITFTFEDTVALENDKDTNFDILKDSVDEDQINLINATFESLDNIFKEYKQQKVSLESFRSPMLTSRIANESVVEKFANFIKLAKNKIKEYLEKFIDWLSDGAKKIWLKVRIALDKASYYFTKKDSYTDYFNINLKAVRDIINKADSIDLSNKTNKGQLETKIEDILSKSKEELDKSLEKLNQIPNCRIIFNSPIEVIEWMKNFEKNCSYLEVVKKYVIGFVDIFNKMDISVSQPKLNQLFKEAEKNIPSYSEINPLLSNYKFVDPKKEIVLNEKTVTDFFKNFKKLKDEILRIEGSIPDVSDFKNYSQKIIMTYSEMEVICNNYKDEKKLDNNVYIGNDFFGLCNSFITSMVSQYREFIYIGIYLSEILNSIVFKHNALLTKTFLEVKNELTKNKVSEQGVNAYVDFVKTKYDITLDAHGNYAGESFSFENSLATESSDDSFYKEIKELNNAFESLEDLYQEYTMTGISLESFDKMVEIAPELRNAQYAAVISKNPSIRGLQYALEDNTKEKTSLIGKIISKIKNYISTFIDWIVSSARKAWDFIIGFIKKSEKVDDKEVVGAAEILSEPKTFKDSLKVIYGKDENADEIEKEIYDAVAECDERLKKMQEELNSSVYNKIAFFNPEGVIKFIEGFDRYSMDLDRLNGALNMFKMNLNNKNRDSLDIQSSIRNILQNLKKNAPPDDYFKGRIFNEQEYERKEIKLSASEVTKFNVSARKVIVAFRKYRDNNNKAFEAFKKFKKSIDEYKDDLDNVFSNIEDNDDRNSITILANSLLTYCAEMVNNIIREHGTLLNVCFAYTSVRNSTHFKSVTAVRNTARKIYASLGKSESAAKAFKSMIGREFNINIDEGNTSANESLTFDEIISLDLRNFN